MGICSNQTQMERQPRAWRASGINPRNLCRSHPEKGVVRGRGWRRPPPKIHSNKTKSGTGTQSKEAKGPLPLPAAGGACLGFVACRLSAVDDRTRAPLHPTNPRKHTHTHTNARARPGPRGGPSISSAHHDKAPTQPLTLAIATETTQQARARPASPRPARCTFILIGYRASAVSSSPAVGYCPRPIDPASQPADRVHDPPSVTAGHGSPRVRGRRPGPAPDGASIGVGSGADGGAGGGYRGAWWI